MARLVVHMLLAAMVAWATPAWGQAIEATTRAYNAAQATERSVAQVAARRLALAQRWEAELRELDRLKKAPRSWRRDREVSAKLSQTDALGRQLAAANAELARATAELAVARGRLVAAIDAELAAVPDGARRSRLEQARAQVVPAAVKARRIVLPELRVDPLADPEELDQQATALRDAETQLVAQLEGLEMQREAFERIAILRTQHDRIHELDQREDDTPRKSASSTTGRRNAAQDDAPAPEAGGGGGSFEMAASITLAEVVDPTTLDTLNRAGRSGDPQRRGAATQQLRDAVKRRLEQVQVTRKRVEDRARQLRQRR